MAKYVRGKGPLFVAVPFELIDDPEVDAVAIAVYVAIRRWADFGKETGSYVSDTRAAAKIGTSRRTFLERRTILKRLGWIDWDRSGRRNIYVVHSAKQDPTCAGDAQINPEDSNSPDTSNDSATCAGDSQAPTPTCAAVAQVQIPICAGDSQVPVQQLHTTEIQLPRKASSSSLRSEEEESSPTDKMGANELLAAWLDHTGVKLSKRMKARHAGVAKRLCDEYSRTQIMAAMIGMTQLFPYSEGTPWDLFQLDRHFAKAMQQARKHPELERAHEEAQILKALEGA